MKNNFSTGYINSLAAFASAATPGFPSEKFIKEACDGLEELEMRQRIGQIGKAYFGALDNNYPRFYDHALQLFANDPSPDNLDWKYGIRYEPIAWITEYHGLEYFEESFTLMKEITQRYTSEFAVRNFISRYPERSLSILQECSRHNSEHLRRWASEGSRPRLPWGKKLDCIIKDPSLTTPILENLKQDSSKYVQRSVANHLNDISKDNPEHFYSMISNWARSKNQHTRWIIKHALRNEVKKGDPRALKILGFTPARVNVRNFALSDQVVPRGGKIELTAALETSNASQKLVIDLGIHLAKQKGKTFYKVFKWKTFEAAPGTHQLSKTLEFRKLTTRQYHPGQHTVELLVNGKAEATANFLLT